MSTHVSPATTSVLMIVIALACAGTARAQVDVPFDERTTTAGDINLAVTNYGRFGNDFRSRASSFEYPSNSGHEHMVRGGLWIGGVVVSGSGLDTLVTTAADDGTEGTGIGINAEFTPSADPSWPPGVNILERSRQPTSPFFSPQALADQELISIFTDTEPAGIPGDENEHVPLNVKVRQTVFTWSFSPFDGIVFVNYEITNLDPSRDIFEMYVAFYSELATGNKDASDRWPPGSLWYGKKDIGYIDSLRVITERRSSNDELQVPTWCGLQLVGARPIDVDSLDVTFWWDDWNFSPPAERNQDTERYALISAGTIDDTQGNEFSAGLDPVTNVAAGPFPVLGASESDTIRVTFAFVGGEETPVNGAPPDLIEHARFARSAFERGFRIPVPPPVPRFLLDPGPNVLTLRWDDSPELAIDAETDTTDFEGYRIYLSRTGLARDFELLKEVDVIDEPQFPPGESQEDIRFNTGLESVLADDPLTIITANDTIVYKYRYDIRNVRDGFNYWAAITSFDRGGVEIGPLETGVGLSRTMTIPGSEPGGDGGTGRRVSVFPNPYRGDAEWDGESRRDRYLWFRNLPHRCTITIYTLAGDRVDRIEFDGDTYDARNVRGIYDPTDPNNPTADLPVMSGGMAAWDLITDNDQAIATGLYLFAVEDHDTGQTEVGQFLVIK